MPNFHMHVLLVEDDLVLADGIARILRGHGGAFDLLPREGGGLLARLTLPR